MYLLFLILILIVILILVGIYLIYSGRYHVPSQSVCMEFKTYHVEVSLFEERALRFVSKTKQS